MPDVAEYSGLQLFARVQSVPCLERFRSRLMPRILSIEPLKSLGLGIVRALRSDLFGRVWNRRGRGGERGSRTGLRNRPDRIRTGFRFGRLAHPFLMLSFPPDSVGFAGLRESLLETRGEGVSDCPVVHKERSSFAVQEPAFDQCVNKCLRIAAPFRCGCDEFRIVPNRTVRTLLSDISPETDQG